MGLLDRVAATLGGDVVDEETRAALSAASGLADEGRLGEAEACLAALAGRRSLPVLMALGEVRARRGDDEGAVEAFGRAVDASMEAVDAHLALGEALVRLGRADPARDAFRRVLSAAADPERRARAHAGRGRLALAAGRAAKAVRELRKAIELSPGSLVIAADLGRALLASGDPEGWQWLMRAAQGGPTAAGGLDPQAMDVGLVIEAARASPRPEAAVALLRAAREAAARRPAHERARLAAELARQRVPADLAEAQALVTEALGVSPDEPAALDAAAVVAEASGDAAQALAAGLRAVTLGAPVAPAALVRLALGAHDRGALERSVAGLPATDPLAAVVRAFVAGTAGEEELVRLGALAASEPARRFVAAALSPGAPPEGNLFALLGYARDLSARTPELAALLPAAARAVEAFDRPLLVAVMGEFNAGKSSFVNALCGAEVAPVGVTPTTATINVVRFGPPGGRVLYHDGRAEDLAAAAVTAFLAGLDGAQAAAVRMVEVFSPVEVLRSVEIVDTPGLNSLRPEHEQVARAFLTDADAIVWLFAVGQAAKASEREALGLARGAGKRVLGVLNKADQASAEELAEVERHVRQSMGERIEALVPLSARDAGRAQARGDARLLEASGLPALLSLLEERFFGHARELKRRTALAALARFEGEARRLAGADPAADGEALAGRRAAIDVAREALAGALAAERVGLRARLEASFRQAAREVLEFVRPRRWPFGERRAEAADEEFLVDLLEDAVAQATDASRRALEGAAAGGPAVPIAPAVDRFRAYARGVLAGGLVERFLHDELGGGRAERPALERALARRVPDVEAELFVPLAAEIDAAYARARAELDAEGLHARMRRLVRAARLTEPIAALADATERLRGG